MPRSIVVPLDGSTLAERAVQVAAPLAERVGADIELLTTRWLNDNRSPRKYLDCVAGFLGDPRFSTVVDGERTAVDAIQHAAEAGGETLVCMTTHGRGRFRWAALGSVTEQVIRHSSKPILLVGPHGEPTWSRDPGALVVCVDDSGVAEREVEEACDWADALDREMTIVHVSHPLDPEDLVDARRMLGSLRDLVATRGIAVKTHEITSTSVAGSLVDLAEESGASMIVMAAHGRRGLARIALGSVTMGVVNASTSPVLVIPPGAE